MRDILSFPDLTQSPQAQPRAWFLAIELLSGELPDLLQRCQSLSPSVMCWAERVCLLDLSSCLIYWQSYAQVRGLKLNQFLQEQLKQLLPGLAYRAVLAEHPWQAVILLPCLAQQDFHGLIYRHSPMGDNLLAALSWEDWWEACSRYASHSGASKSVSEFRQRRRSMELAIRRIGCKQPTRIKSVPAEQMSRRFGRLIGELWLLTWSGSASRMCEQDVLPSFPWRNQAESEELRLKRWLDAPLRDWEPIESNLREDLNRFCLLSSFKKEERILAMEWKIVLYNLQEISVPILFRHPHSLHKDQPHQRTALLQIFYALQKTIQKQHLGDLENPEFWLLGWELCITQKLAAQWRQPSLFAEADEHSWEELLNLENQLSIPLESYVLRNDWVPEDSFALAHATQTVETATEELDSLRSLGQVRPLYLQKKSYRLPASGHHLKWKFCERTMEKWWAKPQQKSVRDYYEVLCDKQMLWVARDMESSFLVLGIYG